MRFFFLGIRRRARARLFFLLSHLIIFLFPKKIIIKFSAQPRETKGEAIDGDGAVAIKQQIEAVKWKSISFFYSRAASVYDKKKKVNCLPFLALINPIKTVYAFERLAVQNSTRLISFYLYKATIFRRLYTHPVQLTRANQYRCHLNAHLNAHPVADKLSISLSLFVHRISEENFWRNYFYRVSLLRQSHELNAMANQSTESNPSQLASSDSVDHTQGKHTYIGPYTRATVMFRLKRRAMTCSSDTINSQLYDILFLTLLSLYMCVTCIELATFYIIIHRRILKALSHYYSSIVIFVFL